MRLALSTVCFIALLVHTSVAEETPSWAWGKEKTGDNPNQDVVPTSTGFSFHDQDLNETNVDGLIDSIISSTRQGRTLQGFDEVYSDPNLQEAIQKGDGQARNLIKDKLCSLGLMECDGVSARRPHHPLSPEDLIYAQPVAIKPIGHPIPSIPVRGPPRGGYGPPKPVPPPHGPSGIYGPPRPIGHGPPRRGYGPPFKPSGSYYESHGSSSSFSSKPLGPIFEPIEPEGPYPFEVPSKIHNKEKLPIEVVVNAQGGSSQSTTANGGVQQHVHHHFHHGEGANVKVPTVVVNNPVPIATQGHIHASSSAGIVGGTIVDNGFAPINSFGGGFKDTSFSTHKDITTATFANANNGLGTYASGVKPIIENYSPQSFGSAGTLSSNSFGSSGTFGSNSFGSSDAFGSNSFGSSGTLGANSFGSSGIHGANSYGNSGTLGSFSTLGTNSFGASVGSYGSSSSPFYKKELNLNRPLNGNSLQSAYGQSSYADSYRGFESIRNENYDCVCVPYDQCPTQDIIGRKDDLYLPLDPRNLKSDIEAITDEVVVTDGNGTMSVIRVPKQIKLDKPVENAESKSAEEAKKVSKREAPLDKNDAKGKSKIEPRQAYIASGFGNVNNCGPRHVCCRRPTRPQIPIPGNGRQCGTKHSQGINGRVKNPSYIDGDSEFGEYPWQVAILKKDPKESVYVCGGTLIDSYHILTAAHCVKTYSGFDLRVRLGEWDVNHDVEFFPYIERDIQSVHVHPEFYAGTLYNDLAILRMNKAVDWTRSPHISPACLPDAYTDYTGARCWTTGWGKDAFGQYGKYQNILKEVDVPIISHAQCQAQMKQTRLGYDFKLHNGFICAGGEEGKDACKGDGGGPMVCERGGSWKVVGVVSWGIGCGQAGVPGVYVKVAHYLDWIKQIVNTY